MKKKCRFISFLRFEVKKWFWRKMIFLYGLHDKKLFLTFLDHFLFIVIKFSSVPGVTPGIASAADLSNSVTLYRICTKGQGNCGKPAPIQSAIKQNRKNLWKMTSRSAHRCVRPQRAVTHPSNVPTEPVLDFGDRGAGTVTTHLALSVISRILFSIMLQVIKKRFTL